MLIVAVILLPLAGALLAFAVPGHARRTGAAAVLLTSAAVIALAFQLSAEGPIRHEVGGWEAPLGIVLEADGLSVFMLLTTAAAGLAAMLYAGPYFRDSEHLGTGFTPLSLLLLTGLNALFLSGDVFNLYVTLEMLGLSAAALVATAGGAAALSGAMRYLLVTFMASLTYLLGVALLYHLTGTLHLRTLGAVLEPVPAAWTALSLMTAAMLIKSALFPLHFWLPPAHANAPSPVSALLSALVVKASLYLLLRLWLEAMPGRGAALGQLVGALGAGAVLWGSVQALRQEQLKLLVAYSTVAQLGYLFLPFAIEPGAAAATAWRGAIYLVLCHALAKSAMFLSVGNIQRAGGDRIAELHFIVRRLPLTTAAFAIAGVTIAGLPPSGGFIAKWLILEALVAGGHRWMAGVVLVGGLLSAVYVFRVIGPAFTKAAFVRAPHRVPASMEWIAFAPAFATLLLGFTAPPLLELLDVGAPLSAAARSPAPGEIAP